jgi:hypothetical protein
MTRGNDRTATVLRYADCDRDALSRLLGRFGLTLQETPPDEDIPGSYWGEAEAGLRGDHLLARPDTPLHSILHEACHFICMDPVRRRGLDTDAGGDFEEENGVCYLQILLADQVPGFGRQRMTTDMDAWGYTFRLGSARAWFERDADDALDWLQHHGLVDDSGQPTYRVRA